MKTITRTQVEDKVQQNAALIDVLSAEQYQKYHLPDAMNVPLGESFDAKIVQLVPDRSQPVVVYCYDEECSASPKAAQRMEELGYTDVYDYEAGKADWKAAGLPVES